MISAPYLLVGGICYTLPPGEGVVIFIEPEQIKHFVLVQVHKYKHLFYFNLDNALPIPYYENTKRT